MSKNILPSPRHREEVTADLIARLARRGQTDKSGADYIEHPRRVALNVKAMGFGHPYTTAGILHDVAEDTEVSLADLKVIFSDEVVRAVDNVTRRRGEGSEAYYQRVRSGDASAFVNEIALVVKIADIQDNTSPERVAKLDPAVQARLAEKYAKALDLLGPAPEGHY